MIPPGDWLLIAIITAACAVAAVAMGALLVRRLTRRSVVLHLVVASLAAVATVAVGEPAYAAPPSPVTSELTAVAAALSLAHRRLATPTSGRRLFSRAAASWSPG